MMNSLMSITNILSTPLNSRSSPSSKRVSNNIKPSKSSLAFPRCSSLNTESLVLHHTQPIQATNTLIYFISKDFVPELTWIVGSCNGLVCLAELRQRYDPVHVCNPDTGENFLLPTVSEANIDIASGFVFDQVAGKYKAIRIYNNWDGDYVTEIFTLGVSDDEWQNAGNAPYPVSGTHLGQVLVNGALHWFIDDPPLILAFDIVTEKFLEIPLPPGVVSRIKSNIGRFWMHLKELGGYLCFVDVLLPDDDRMDIWVMKEHGVECSWTTEYVVSTGDDRS